MYTESMSSLRARVKDGRLILDQPTSLPDGTTLDLVLDDESDDLTPQERTVLDDAIAMAWTSAKAGRVRPTDGLIRDLRHR